MDQQGRGAFLLLSRKPDTEYTFDVGGGSEKNNENQKCTTCRYAHARICLGCCRHGAAMRPRWGLSILVLDTPAAQALMLQLAKYPEMLTAATDGEAPHDVTFYLRDLAASYHSYYDAGAFWWMMSV